MKKQFLKRYHGRGGVHDQVKDRLFRFLFEKNREALLELYNALNGTDYEDASKLQVVTIESAVYTVMKNDLAFILAGTVNLYEHQSTYNPNMPVRLLTYLAQEYQMIIEESPVSIYSTRRITLPTPNCIVFYNGDREEPEEQILRLSDAFENRKQRGDAELSVRMLNINHGHNKKLMEQCRMLKEYAAFVDVTKKYVSEAEDRKEALGNAIEYCIGNNILKEFLRKYRMEVLGMLLEEFDVEKYERTMREDGRIEGIQQGEEQKLIEQICRKVRKGKTLQIIAEELEEEESSVSKIYDTVLASAPDYDCSKVYALLHNDNK